MGKGGNSLVTARGIRLFHKSWWADKRLAAKLEWARPRPDSPYLSFCSDRQGGPYPIGTIKSDGPASKIAFFRELPPTPGTSESKAMHAPLSRIGDGGSSELGEVCEFGSQIIVRARSESHRFSGCAFARSAKLSCAERQRVMDPGSRRWIAPLRVGASPGTIRVAGA
jgi:hypothetical protein